MHALYREVIGVVENGMLLRQGKRDVKIALSHPTGKQMQQGFEKYKSLRTRKKAYVNISNIWSW